MAIKRALASVLSIGVITGSAMALSIVAAPDTPTVTQAAREFNEDSDESAELHASLLEKQDPKFRDKVKHEDYEWKGGK